MRLSRLRRLGAGGWPSIDWGFGIGLMAAASLASGQSENPAQGLQSSLSPIELEEIRLEPRELQAFELEDHRGDAFTREDLSGGWDFLMFGFTHCPDICPVHLAMLKQMRGELREADYAEADLPRVVLVSVDPKRDTPEHLARYVGHFDPSFVGASGEVAELKALESSLDAGHRIFSEDVEGTYDVMHTSAVYVLDPQARLVGQIRPPFNPRKLAAAFHVLRQGEAGHEQ